MSASCHGERGDVDVKNSWRIGVTVFLTNGVKGNDRECGVAPTRWRCRAVKRQCHLSVRRWQRPSDESSLNSVLVLFLVIQRCSHEQVLLIW